MVALALAATFAMADGRGALPAERTSAIATEITSDKWKYFPIPQAEIDRNPAIEQTLEWR